MDANNRGQSQQINFLTLSYLNLMYKGRKRRFRAVKCRFRIYSKRCVTFSILVHINCTDKLQLSVIGAIDPFRLFLGLRSRLFRLFVGNRKIAITLSF